MRCLMLILAMLAGDVYGMESDQPLISGLRLQLPAVVEEGDQVPLRIGFEAALDADEYLQEIHVRAPLNPQPGVVSFELSAEVMPIRLATRIRLSQSQRVEAWALSSKGRRWQTAVDVRVALSGCLTGVAPAAGVLRMQGARVSVPVAGLGGEIKAQVRHPMENGFRDGVRDFSIIPSRVASLTVMRSELPLLTVRFHAGAAANPYVSFWLQDSHGLKFIWQDIEGRELHR